MKNRNTEDKLSHNVIVHALVYEIVYSYFNNRINLQYPSQDFRKQRAATIASVYNPRSMIEWGAASSLGFAKSGQ